MDQARLKTIEDNPIEVGRLDSFRAIFRTICQDRNLTATPESLESLGEDDLEELAIDLLLTLSCVRVSRLLPSSSCSNDLRTNLSKLVVAVTSNDYDLDRIKPLLVAVISENSVDTLIWEQVYAVVAEYTPPPQTIASSETPRLLSAAYFSNSSDYRKYMDGIWKEELGALYVGLPRFHETFFGAVPELDRASKAVFEKCLEGDEPLFRGGWRDWPADANLDGVLSWLSSVIGKLEDLAQEFKPTPTLWRRPLAQHSRPVQESTVDRKLDVGFVKNPDAQKDSRCRWSQILVNVGRHYHHETVRVGGRDGDASNNIKAGMDVRDASSYREENLTASSRTSTVVSEGVCPCTSLASSRKRPSNYSDTVLPPSKRACSTYPAKQQTTVASAGINRIHQRIVLRDFGKPIYKASSRVSLLSALEACIEGHESLHSKAGILHRDISINNLMINEDEENPSWRAFLSDLDLSIKDQREGASGARENTAITPFMSIGVLLGEQHSFMHDLESFFWVLLWICIHYDGPHRGIVFHEDDEWNPSCASQLANLKKGHINDEGDFLSSSKKDFTQYCHPLVPWVNKLRRVVFPNDRRWQKEDTALYSRFRKILRDAREDQEVSQASE